MNKNKITRITIAHNTKHENCTVTFYRENVYGCLSYIVWGISVRQAKKLQIFLCHLPVKPLVNIEHDRLEVIYDFYHDWRKVENIRKGTHF